MMVRNAAQQVRLRQIGQHIFAERGSVPLAEDDRGNHVLAYTG